MMAMLSTGQLPDLRAALTEAGIDPNLEGSALQEALQEAIALRRSSCTWTKVHTGWLVTLHHPERRIFFGASLEEALAWCLVRLMTREREAQVFPH